MFTPFVPRRKVEPPTADPESTPTCEPAAQEDRAANQVDASVQATIETPGSEGSSQAVGNSEPELENELETQTGAAPQTDIAPQNDAAPMQPMPSAQLSGDTPINREEAIRIAAIACGRALRRALLIDPRVIAAFVDDALAAAGGPKGAEICVHSMLVQHLTNQERTCVADDGLEAGEVVVRCDDLTVGASIATRAELLVRSVSA